MKVLDFIATLLGWTLIYLAVGYGVYALLSIARIAYYGV
jgi:hypothetical protein